ESVYFALLCRSTFGYPLFEMKERLMPITSRRTFLREVGLACSAGALIGPELMCKGLTQGNAFPVPDVTRVYVDNRRIIAPLDRNLFGSFLEHLGRAIYGG